VLQFENASKLDAIRVTVDEKLQGTLEAKLGESFRLVSEHLEQVHKGLGEMQTLASGVGDLKKVLSNVKTRGTWGEIQLRQLLDQVLVPDQYAANVVTREGSDERVEFAIKLPGRGADDTPVLLPIDAKFPLEDYQRLVDAADRGDADAVEAAARQLEASVKVCARDIRDKYLNPPRTTDFGILFLPVEGLCAEVLRRAGLVDQLQRDFHVVPCGPTTLWALLNSLQMGFRTLAIERRSSEVWTLLGAVKTEFAKFGEALDAVQKKLGEASDKIDAARKGTRKIQRKLQDVQELPAAEAAPLVGEATDDGDEGSLDQR
jgi:DNA recombination protein RmuC